MPMVPIKIAPGIYTEQTDRGALNRWKSGNKVRFRADLPEKIGGWNKNSANVFQGICRGLLPFVSLANVKYLGLGTHLKLYAWNGGSYFDITPIRSTGTLALNPFTTTNASAVVTVAHTAHGALNGDFVTYAGAAAVGGITINGEYQLTYVDGNSYTITHSAAATSAATGGGAAVTYSYQINVGAADSTAGLGYGVGTWGSGTWGTARTTSDIVFGARTWSLASWGEDMIASPSRGGIYVWDTSVGTGTRAAVITNAPSTARAILVSPSARILIALGAHDGTTSDPLLVRWCSEENYTDWTPSSTNTAGDQRIDTGTEIVAGVATNTEILLLTDSSAIAMIYSGPPYTFDFKQRGGSGMTIAGPNAATEANGRVFWMGKSGFYVYDGLVRDLPSDVRNHVYDNINTLQFAKVWCGLNVEFQEVWWFYCSAASTEIDLYVSYNYEKGYWMTGTLSRTAFYGDGNVFTSAIATGTDGYLYDHEVGSDNSGAAMSTSLESYDMDIGEGDDMLLVSKLVPDFKRLAGAVSVTLKGRRYPQDTEQITKGPYTISVSTKFINPRLRTRQVAVLIESTLIGDDWRMGEMRADVQPDGGR